MVRVACGLAWSWVTSSALVNDRTVCSRPGDIPFERVSWTTYPMPRALCFGQALHQLARPVSRHEDHRRQAVERQNQTLRQPGGTSLAPGGSRPAQQPVGARCVFPAHGCTHGQAQGRHGGRPQAGAPDLHDADQGGKNTRTGRTTSGSATDNARCDNWPCVPKNSA